MAAGAGRDRDQPVDPGLGRLAGMLHIDDVVEHQPAIGMDGIDHLLRRAQRGDDQRHLVLDRGREIGLQARIALMDDDIDAERRGLLARFPSAIAARR